MQQTNPNPIDELWEMAVECLPAFSSTEQHVGVALLAELARGEPVSPVRLGRALGVDEEEAAAYLHDSALSFAVHSNEEGSALGFFGLSVVPTGHRFEVEGRTLWTWCGADTLFLPELLDATARVESKDPVTEAPIELTVAPAAVESIDPDTAVLSMSSPHSWDTTSAVRLITTACHYIHFFGSQESSRQWTDAHPDTVFLSVEDTFASCRRQNQRMFGVALAERASATND